MAFELPRWVRACLWLVGCLAMPVVLTVHGAQLIFHDLATDRSPVNWIVAVTLIVVAPPVLVYAAVQTVRKVPPSSTATDIDRTRDEQIDGRTTL